MQMAGQVARLAQELTLMHKLDKLGEELRSLEFRRSEFFELVSMLVCFCNSSNFLALFCITFWIRFCLSSSPSRLKAWCYHTDITCLPAMSVQSLPSIISFFIPAEKHFARRHAEQNLLVFASMIHARWNMHLGTCVVDQNFYTNWTQYRKSENMSKTATT